MATGRNEPCPCGSGKKYKKCCIKAENVIHMHQRKEERFFDTKNKLVHKMLDFLYAELTPTQENQIKREFKKSFVHGILPSHRDKLFVFWLSMFYRFEHGQRGVEWFWEKKKNSLSSEEKAFGEIWVDLIPRVMQVVDHEDQGVTVEDVFTHEKLFMPYSETLIKLSPWSVSFGFVEPFLNGYCINGIISWVSPFYKDQFVDKIKMLMQEKEKPYAQVVLDHYLEILSISIGDSQHKLAESDLVSSQIEVTYLTYKMLDRQKIIDLLWDDPSFIVDEWGVEKGSLSWVGEWYRYEDNLSPEPIFLAPSFAKVKVERDQLLFSSFLTEKVEQFEKQIKPFPSAIQLVNKKTEAHEVPVSGEVMEYCVHLDKETPHYFAHFAQNQLRFMSELDKPLSILNYQTPRELAKRKEYTALENWLRILESHSFEMVSKQYGEAAHTEDFNKIRSELGLPLSPYVSMGEKRRTSISSCSNPNPKPKRIHHEDIPIFEQLNFTPETAKTFFGQDLVDFYKAKTEGKSQGTINKYEVGTRIIVSYLTFLMERVTSWNDCTEEFWDYLISYYYLDKSYDTSANQLSSFLTTVKSFTKFLDNKYGTTHQPVVKEICVEVEQELLRCIYFLDSHITYNARKYQPESMRQFGQQIRRIFGAYDQQIESLFQVIDDRDQHIKVIDLNGEKGPRDWLGIRDTDSNALRKGMIFCGMIGKQKRKQWEIVDIERVYPQRALPFI
jgi:hypothetical protein